MTNKVTETAPTTIYLNVAEDDHSQDLAFPKGCSGDEVGWSVTPALTVAVEYVRADLVRAAMPSNWTDDEETEALGEALKLTRPEPTRTQLTEALPVPTK